MTTLELGPVVVALPAALSDLFARAHIPESYHHAYADALMAEGFESPQALALLDADDLTHCGITLKAHVKLLLQAVRSPAVKEEPGMILRCPTCTKAVSFSPGVQVATCECGKRLVMPAQPFTVACQCGQTTTMPMGVSEMDCKACCAGLGVFAREQPPQPQTMQRDAGGTTIVIQQQPPAEKGCIEKLLGCLVCIECCRCCCCC